MGQDEIIIEIGQLKVRISPQKAIKSKNRGCQTGYPPSVSCERDKIASLHYTWNKLPFFLA